MAETAAARLDHIRDQIAATERETGREQGSVTLIAVSKTFDAPDIEPVIAAGQRIFGENRVQEAQGKWPALKEATPDIELHLIGPLQSNKTREAVALFDAIHTIDRDKIARTVKTEMEAQGRDLKLFIQINTGNEPQKAGISPDEADAFIARCRDEFGLKISGLMCIPPLNEAPSPHFALLAKIAERNGLEGLSMGMSGDFEMAVGQGATHVRVGSAIFGTRDYPAKG
ncbi:YggS family pyridoxal phosphate-dependent enzyme [Breoghania sp.]|uniref:YggS family pyridoxal phosphate-dependent enzyme n=1 Tax=Breoghania sp. TaxID=2065378 RepID=UPI002AA65766|nr:YggS family pyridoxal phosphate-dependent enzyme [Breoghania sp.]